MIKNKVDGQYYLFNSIIDKIITSDVPFSIRYSW